MANQSLGKALGYLSIEMLESIEGKVAAHSKSKRLAGFKKTLDQPLLQVIKQKRAMRAALAGRRVKHRIV